MRRETLIVERREAVLRVRIDRPEADNSIDATLTRELAEVLAEAEADDGIRVLVLAGGADVFCSGLDLDSVRAATPRPGELRADAEAYYDLLRAMSGGSQAVVALVEGRVNAGGVGLVAASDLVIAGSRASFALSELLFGLLPACVLPFLARRVGVQRARQLALTTQAIGVDEAHRWGLVDEWDEQPEQLLRRRLLRLSRLDAAAVGRLKRYVGELDPLSAETRELAVGTIASLLADASIRGAIRRYVESGVLPWQS